MFNINLNNRGDNRVLLILLVIDKVINKSNNLNKKDKENKTGNIISSVMSAEAINNSRDMLQLLWNQKQISLNIQQHNKILNKSNWVLSNSVMGMKTKAYLISKENNWRRNETKKDKSKSMNRELLNNSKKYKIDQIMKLNSA